MRRLIFAIALASFLGIGGTAFGATGIHVGKRNVVTAPVLATGGAPPDPRGDVGASLTSLHALGQGSELSGVHPVAQALRARVNRPARAASGDCALWGAYNTFFWCGDVDIWGYCYNAEAWNSLSEDGQTAAWAGTYLMWCTNGFAITYLNYQSYCQVLNGWQCDGSAKHQRIDMTDPDGAAFVGIGTAQKVKKCAGIGDFIGEVVKEAVVEVGAQYAEIATADTVVEVGEVALVIAVAADKPGFHSHSPGLDGCTHETIQNPIGADAHMIPNRVVGDPNKSVPRSYVQTGKATYTTSNGYAAG